MRILHIRQMHAAILLSFIALMLDPSEVRPAEDEFEKEPILYSQSKPQNRVSVLQERLKHGEVEIPYSKEMGYLPALLKALEVPVESQVLVFSKTSLQMMRISPRKPRAIFFNDDVYVGYCQSGEVLEISVSDPLLGAVFYTLDQQEGETPAIIRRTENCLVCHSSSRMEGVPGHVIRSLYVESGGQPLMSAGGRTVDHTTPIEDRWGGWYVTGTHGSQKHIGNLVIHGRNVVEPVDNSAGLNVVDLKYRIDPDYYPTMHSDIVALMVMEHQTLVHNRLTKASFETRQALAYDEFMNSALGEPDATTLESTTRRIQGVADRLVDSMLLVNEAKIVDPIRGTSGFAEIFATAGPRDSQGRSLRDLDLTTRMFKYPCSYLIYSPTFDSLPREVLDRVYQRLWDILSGAEQSEKYAHLGPEDRTAIVEILRETKQNLPEYWKQ
jgi:hypothetical protein